MANLVCVRHAPGVRRTPMAQSTEGEAHDARRRAAKHLETLYATVIAVGLGVAVTSTVTIVHEDLKVEWDHVPLVAALLFTLVPFYQGALLHLDNKYRRDEVGTNATVVLLLDFGFLFLEAVVIVALAASVADVGSFLVAGAALLAIDVIWATVAFRLTRPNATSDRGAGNGSSKDSDEELSEWIRINAATLMLFAIGCLAQIWVDSPDWALTTIAGAGALIRSTVDYSINADFYAGRRSSEAAAT
jgi:hypothetical protein